MTTTINMNVSDYTLSELMAILEIDDLTPSNIIENSKFYIKKYYNNKFANNLLLI